MKKNRGYTLVETLIVIAIMAIVSGMAFVTIGIVYQAKYNAAIDSFHTQLDGTWIRTKALSQADVGNKPLCLLIKENTNDQDDVRDGSYELILGYRDGASFTQKEVMATITDIVDIKYTSSDSDQETSALTVSSVAGGAAESLSNPMLVEFVKSDGSVRRGAGVYEFIYNNRVVGTVYLDQMTGNHYKK